MGRRTLYSEGRVEAILQAIREGRGDRAAAEAAQINKDTLYAWQAAHPDFAEKVLQARQEYRDNCPRAYRRQAQKAFADYLYGRVEETWVTEEVIEDGDKIINKTVTKRIKRGVPQWAIERVIGPTVDVVAIVQAAAEAGLLPADAEERLHEKVAELRQLAEQIFNDSSNRQAD